MNHPGFSGTGTLRAPARAPVIAEALEKRSAGSLARLRRMTSETACEMFGLIEAGEGGILLISCIRMSDALSPSKGNFPVQSS